MHGYKLYHGKRLVRDFLFVFAFFSFSRLVFDTFYAVFQAVEHVYQQTCYIKIKHIYLIVAYDNIELYNYLFIS